MRSWILALALGLFGAACGGGKPKPSYKEADLQALIPADADLVARLRSCGSAQRAVAELAAGLDMRGEVPDLRARIADLAGMHHQWLADDQPLAFAVSGPVRHRTLIVPSRDPAVVRGRPNLPVRRARGGYVALSSRENPPGERPRMVDSLPDADLALCVDMTAAANWHGESIAAVSRLLEEAWRNVPLAALWPECPGLLREAVASGETLTLGVDVKRTTVTLDVAYVARANTAFAAAPRPSRLADLARFAPPELFSVSLLRLDPALVASRYAAFGRELVGGTDGLAGQFFDRLDEFSRVMAGTGDEWMAAYRIDDESLAFVAVFRDPAPAARAAALRAGIGMHGPRFEPTENGYRARAALPRKAPFPAILVDIAPLEDVVVLTASTDAAFAGRVLASQAPPPPVAAALDGVRGELSFLAWADMRAVVRGVSAFQRAIGELPSARPGSGPPVPLFVYGAGEDRTFRARFRCDPVAIKQLFGIR